MGIQLVQETTLAPSSIVKDSNCTGAVTDIDEPVDSPDGNKIEPVDETVTYRVRCNFDPPPNLTLGGGLQTFRIWALRHSSGGTPESTYLALSLGESGEYRRVLSGPFITEIGGQLVEGTFDIAEVVDPTELEAILDAVANDGTRNVDIDAVEWVATHDASIAPSESLGEPTLSSPTEVLPVSIAASEALGEPSLGFSIQLGSIAPSEALGEPTLSLQTFEIEPVSIAPSELLGIPSLGIGGEIEWASIAATEALGSPTLTAGDPLITLQSIPASATIGIPVVRRVDVPPELANRLKPGSFKMLS
jgi:hypothetical protein